MTQLKIYNDIIKGITNSSRLAVSYGQDTVAVIKLDSMLRDRECY